MLKLRFSTFDIISYLWNRSNTLRETSRQSQHLSARPTFPAIYNDGPGSQSIYHQICSYNDDSEWFDEYSTWIIEDPKKTPKIIFEILGSKALPQQIQQHICPYHHLRTIKDVWVSNLEPCKPEISGIIKQIRCRSCLSVELHKPFSNFC